MSAYATVQDLRLYLDIASTTDDTLLTALLERASAWIDFWCGRTFQASSDSVRYFHAVDDVDGRTLYLDRDLASLTSVTNGDGTDVTSYVVTVPNDPPHYALVLKASSGKSWTYTNDPENAISVTGKWAYSTSPPSDIVHATLRLAAYMYRQKDAQVFDTVAVPEAGVITIPQGIPADVRMLLAPYRRHV